MPRSDGITDGFESIQGVRSFDSSAGTWTTPDAYAGVAEAPSSQKGYIWNGNNPMDYSDPTGYDQLQVGFWPAVQMPDGVVLIWHIYAVLENDNGEVIRAYSYGPSSQYGGFLNKDYGLGDVFAQLWAHAPLFEVASCFRTCSWEAAWNRYYDLWPDNTVKFLQVEAKPTIFGVTLFGFADVSGSAMSDQFKYTGFSTDLPAGSPSNVGGWNQPSGWAGPGYSWDGVPMSSSSFVSSEPASNIDPNTGFDYTFEQNAQQAEGFANQGQQFIY